MVDGGAPDPGNVLMLEVASARAPTDPLSALLTTGLDLLHQLGLAPTARGPEARADAGGAPSAVERVHDPGTGQSYLKIRMPEPEVVGRVADALHALLESLRR